jgi:tRNA threonylcarbamoyladenosine biosynthesis protein TsaB
VSAGVKPGGTSWILALDTTRERGGVALLRGGAVVEELGLESPTGFAHIIYGHLRELLDRHRVAVADVDCFAAASGPGSFTGVRVGLACVKGLAEAVGRPAVGISNLQALAAFGAGPLRAAVLDARRGEIYGAVYDAAGRLVSPEVVAKLDSWIRSLPAGELEFVTEDTVPVPAALAGTPFAEARVTAAPGALAAAIGRIAYARLIAGEASDPAALDANYVRRSDAELFWKE